MPIAKEILSMFEFDFEFDFPSISISTLSQEKGVSTD